jgi:hypothetical protein
MYHDFKYFGQLSPKKSKIDELGIDADPDRPDPAK